jgi:hypothetical protein
MNPSVATGQFHLSGMRLYFIFVEFWDKLQLEPYSCKKDVAYHVICPNNISYLPANVNFFKELNNMYQVMIYISIIVPITI